MKFIKLLFGFSVFRLLSIASFVVATFLFSPRALAIYGVWLAASSLLSLLANFRLDQQLFAVKRQQTLGLFRLCWTVNVYFCLLQAAAIFIFAFVSGHYLWMLLPLAILSRGLKAIVESWFVSQQQAEYIGRLMSVEGLVRILSMGLVFVLHWHGSNPSVYYLLIFDIVAIFLSILFGIHLISDQKRKTIFTLYKPELALNRLGHLHKSLKRNAISNFVISFFDIALSNLPVIAASLFLSPVHTAAFLLLQRIGETIRSFVTVSISSLMVQSIQKNVYSDLDRNLSNIQIYRSYNIFCSIVIVFVISITTIIYFLVKTYLSEIWNLAWDYIFVFMIAYFFYALTSLSIKYLTINRMDIYSLYINLVSIGIILTIWISIVLTFGLEFFASETYALEVFFALAIGFRFGLFFAFIHEWARVPGVQD